MAMDAELLVERTFRKLGTNHDLVPLYNKWFVSRMPTGERMNVAISPQLEDAFKEAGPGEAAHGSRRRVGANAIGNPTKANAEQG